MHGSDSGSASPSDSLSSRADTGSEASTPTVFASVARTLTESGEAAAAAAAATAALRTAAHITALEREASSLRARLAASEERATHNERLAAARELEQGCSARRELEQGSRSDLGAISERELEQGCAAPGAAARARTDDNEELHTLRRRVGTQEQERRAVMSILERRLKPGLEAVRTQLQAHQVHSAQREVAALSELVMRSIAALQTDNPYSAR